MHQYDSIYKALGDEVLERFLRYVKINTASDESLALEKTPSTECQWDLLRLLESELKSMGVDEVSIDDCGYLIARIHGNLADEDSVETIGFMAHVDTNSDVPGNNVKPIVHSSYGGEVLKLAEGQNLDPLEFPLLNDYIGETIITSDGTSLLGADDKAGIAEIMTAMSWLLGHPEIKHGGLEIIFTPDEETGSGMDRFPIERIKSFCCFTMDGGREGELDTECYNACKADIHFTGRSIHPGSGRGKLVNAVSMAAAYVSMLPRNESPEATDGRYGNYWPHRIEGEIESARLMVPFRSFERHDIERRTDALHSFAHAVEAAFPGGKVDVHITRQYENMKDEIDKHPSIGRRLHKAFRASGVEPIEEATRGGTDGSRLSAMGIPCPNIFAGGQNFHSRLEWVALPAMLRGVTVILNLVSIWAQK